MTATRQWLITVAAVLGALWAISTVKGETIYHINGLFAPALSTQATTPFEGTLSFPNDVINNGFISITLLNEPDQPREAAFAMTLNLPGSPFQPWDTRLFAGQWQDEPFTMLSLDYDMTSGNDLSALSLQDGGGWDGWLVSFPDYPAGSISYMNTAPAVNEPAGLALLGVGGLVVLLTIRHAGSR